MRDILLVRVYLRVSLIGVSFKRMTFAIASPTKLPFSDLNPSLAALE